MKTKELRDKTDAELGDELLKLRREQAIQLLRMQSATGQGANYRAAQQGAPVDRALENRAARAREEISE